MQPILSLTKRLEAEFPVTITLSENDMGIVVHAIIVRENQRGQGIGTAVLRAVMAYAREKEKSVALTPAGDFGGSRRKLTKWYKSLGFRENRGYFFKERLIWP